MNHSNKRTDQGESMSNADAAQVVRQRPLEWGLSALANDRRRVEFS